MELCLLNLLILTDSFLCNSYPDVLFDSIESLPHVIFFFFLTGIHSMQGWTATSRHGVTKKEAQKTLQNTKNLFKKNLQLKDVCQFWT